MKQNKESFQHIQLPKGQSLLLYETNSIPKGYVSVQHLLQNLDIHLLEVSPIAPGRLMVLANPISKDLQKGYEMVETIAKNDLVALTAIEQIHKDVLLAFYGLMKTPLQDILLVMETSSIVFAINATHQLCKKELMTPIEIRSSRGLAGKSLVYATLEKAAQQQVEDDLKQHKQQVLDFALISSAHPYWKSLF